jgi:hypothetical protein
MTKIFRMLAVILIAISTIGISATSANASDVQIPFDGTYSGTAAFGPNGPFFNGTGISTHLGSGTNQGYSVITGFDNSSCLGGVANINYETLNAANGDLLYIASDDVACPTGPNMYNGTGTWVVTGGTGRFSGTTGYGTFEGHSDFNQGQFTMHLIGTISAPNQP